MEPWGIFACEGVSCEEAEKHRFHLSRWLFVRLQLVYARAGSPWQGCPSGAFLRISVYAYEVSSEACRMPAVCPSCDGMFLQHGADSVDGRRVWKFWGRYCSMAVRRLARERPRSKTGSSCETGARHIVIFNLVKVRRSCPSQRHSGKQQKRIASWSLPVVRRAKLTIRFAALLYCAWWNTRYQP